MGDLKARLRMGTQEPLFELRQEAADRIAELEAALREIYRHRWVASEMFDLIEAWAKERR